MLCATNRDQLDWGADYRLFSRSPWKTQDLFEPAINRSLDYRKDNDFICIAGDETKIKRSGRKVKRSRWMRDPVYLLTDAGEHNIKKLIQVPVDRWEIEVNHRGLCIISLSAVWSRFLRSSSSMTAMQAVKVWELMQLWTD